MTVDGSIHYWIIFGNIATAFFGFILLTGFWLGTFGRALGILALLLVALSLIFSKAGRLWNEETFWEKTVIAVGPVITAGAVMLLIASLFYDDERPQTYPWRVTPYGSSVKPKRQKEKKDSSQDEQTQ